MSITWFIAKLDVDATRKNTWGKVREELGYDITKPTKGEVGFYDLYQDGNYVGWVEIHQNGEIEFGEPGV